MKKIVLMVVALQTSFAMANYITFIGQNDNPVAPSGRLDTAANWDGGVAPSGSSTGLVYTTSNVWLPSAWTSLAVRQTGGYIYKPSGDLSMRGGAVSSGIPSVYEIEDSRTDYAAYTNLYVSGKLEFWSAAGENIELSVLSGRVELDSLNLLDKTKAIINMGDGILHANSMTTAKGRVNMLANGSGEIIMDEYVGGLGNNLFLNFGMGNTGSFTLGEKSGGLTAGGSWEWIINNGQVSIDGVVDTDVASYLITTNGPLGTTISLPLPLGSTENYVAWAAGYGLVNTNGDAALTADPDGDFVDNLAEYGMGGNPTNQNDQGNVPMSDLVLDGGTNWLEYVYFERSDKAELGLGYTLERNLDLLIPAWTNGGIVHMGSGTMDVDFNTVTNRIEADAENKQFLRLRIELQE